MFDIASYAPYPGEIQLFGDAWCGPSHYEHAREHLIARYMTEEGAEGQTVEIFCTSLPARFYSLRAIEGRNSEGTLFPAFVLVTGSGLEMARLASDMGKAVAAGMLYLQPT